MKQQSLVLLRIREMILRGGLAPGQRVPEAQIAEMLGISRTPVRQALPLLAQEGLLVEAGARGFAVRGFTTQDIAQAVDARGALEGLAARALGDRGVPKPVLRALRDCLAEGDAIFAKRHLIEEDEDRYGAMNGRFHALVVSAAGVPILAELLERVNRIPFASPGTIAFDKLDLAQMFDNLWYAHRQHHDMVFALEHGDGARAEALFREHVNTQKHSMNLRRPPLAQSPAPVRGGDPHLTMVLGERTE